MNKIFKREFYINQIVPFVKKPVIKVVLWQRRVWKSYILLMIIDFLKKQWIKSSDICYINKEDLKWDHIKDYTDLYNITKKYKYVFIDEIQEISSWEKCVRSLLLEKKDVYLSWSNSDLLSWELATYLSWRYVSFEVFSLTYMEFLQFHNLEYWENSFYDYIKYWWLPYLVNMVLNDEVYKYLKDIKNTIILKDVVSRFKIKNINFYEKLLEYVGKNIWSIFSANSISNYLKSQKIKLNTNMVVEYLTHTKLAFLINEVSRYDIKWKKLFEIKNKYYYTDIWIRNSLVGWYAINDISWILENIVYINLRAYWWTICVWEFGSYEIDFVCEKNGKKIYIQVAYLLKDSSTIQREFWNLEKINDNYPKYVLSMDKLAGESLNWIIHKNLIDFIYNIDCL